MPTVSDILSRKGETVHSIHPTATVQEAVHKMNQNHIGALVVMEDNAVVGMFTERDVLKLVGLEQSPRDIKVADVMTRNVLYCHPQTAIDDAGELMLQKRIRHLPVCCSQTGRLYGMISIGDINAYNVMNQEQQIQGLSNARRRLSGAKTRVLRSLPRRAASHIPSKGAGGHRSSRSGRPVIFSRRSLAAIVCPNGGPPPDPLHWRAIWEPDRL